MEREAFPDFQWAIVTLTDGSDVAGYVHRERDVLNRVTVEIDVPAAAGWPANTAAVDAHQVRYYKPCTKTQVLDFIRQHGWPTGGKVSPLIRRAIDADLRPQGAD